jgi:transposase
MKQPPTNHKSRLYDCLDDFSDGGLLVMRELDDVLGLSDLASGALNVNRRGKNTVHRLDGLFRQSVYDRLAGYEDVNDADRLALDPVMHQVVGGRAVDAQAGEVTTPTASAKTAMRAIAKRWLVLHEEVQAHDLELAALVELRAPKLMAAHGIGAMTAAEMLILVGDNPERIKSEAALAKLCGVCPIPASSGKTNRMRLNRGGNRQANAALYIVAITRMRNHEATRSYVVKRIAQGKTKREFIRCLKRYIVREIYQHLCVHTDAKCAA